MKGVKKETKKKENSRLESGFNKKYFAKDRTKIERLFGFWSTIRTIYLIVNFFFFSFYVR